MTKPFFAQAIPDKVFETGEKDSKIGQDQKNLMSTFAHFLTAIAKV